MPSSAVVLRLGQHAIAVELTLPIGELASAWERSLPWDAARTVQQYGTEIKAYIGNHIHAATPDGRAWQVSVGEVTSAHGSEPEVCVGLTLTPPPGSPVDCLTLRYDATTPTAPAWP